MLTWVVMIGLYLCAYACENLLMCALQTCALDCMCVVSQEGMFVDFTRGFLAHLLCPPDAVLSPGDMASPHRKLTGQGGAN